VKLASFYELAYEKCGFGNIDTLSALPFEGAGSGRVQPLQVGFHNLLPAAHKLASKLELLRGQNDNPAIQIPSPESSGKILLEENYFDYFGIHG
jgi:hypothetical protein